MDIVDIMGQAKSGESIPCIMLEATIMAAVVRGTVCVVQNVVAVLLKTSVRLDG